MFFRIGSYSPESWRLSWSARRFRQELSQLKLCVPTRGLSSAARSIGLATTPQECFGKSPHFPPAGQNAVRVEVLATAFTNAVITMRDGELTVISGSAEAGANLPSQRGRVVAFR